MLENKQPSYDYYNLVIIAVLGFSSGLPLALTGATLQAWLAEKHVNIITIGMLGLVTQPYVYKFLWAPLLDRFALPFLGYRTGWILLMQLLLALMFFIVSFCDPIAAPLTLALLAFVIALLSATQDIAFDAYRTELLSENERGIGSVVYVYGYRIALIVSGGGALLLSYYVGWQVTYIAMAVIMALCCFATLMARDPRVVHNTSGGIKAVVVDPFMEFFNRNNAVLLLLLIVTYKLGEAFAMSLTTPFLIQVLHFTTKDIGIVVKTFGTIATLVGLTVGGSIINRLGLYYSLLCFGLLHTLTNCLYLWLLAVGHNYFVMALTIMVEQFSGGLGTAALMVLLMSICNTKFTATQFALFSALASLGRVYVAPISGFMVDAYGWELFYIFSVIICLPSLVILRILKPQILNEKELGRDDGLARSY